MTRFPASSTCMALLLLFAAPVLAVPAVDPITIVKAERAFARQVRSQGVRAGFLEWLTPTAVVFNPGPVNGVANYEAKPAGWHGLLAWHPVRAAISADGGMGWSTGPWTWRRDSTQRKPDAFGEYISVWRHQADGSWKAVLDCGIGHPEGAAVETTVTYSAPVPGTRLGSQPLAARQSLYQADASFARIAASEGVPGALARYGTDDLIVLREGARRMTGRTSGQTSVLAREKQPRLVSNAQYIANSGDMGYTYGSFVSGTTAAPDSAWYVHVWHRGAAASWRLALQVVMPVPKSTPK